MRARQPVVGSITEERVKKELRADRVRREAERLARRAEKLVTVRPRELVSVRPSLSAEEYGRQRVRRRGLEQLLRGLKHPLARAIVSYEVIGPPLALRSPERTLADYG